ncbi:MAG: methyltransferase [Planctomycetes bacterium]|nr:methyltransferase [Planctomycetota bacterium]
MKSSKRKLLNDRALAAQAVKTPVAEQLLIEEIPAVIGPRVLCTTLGRGQFAQVAAEYAPESQVRCHCLDLYEAHAAESHCGTGPGKPLFECSADFPSDEFDLVAIPVDPRGETELTRDLLQSGYDRLAEGGRLLTATSNPDDQWLHDEMRKLFDKVTRKPQRKKGVVYLATRSGSLKKHKNFHCEFAFRDQERLFKVVSRPGVFSHRSLDAGARALMNTMQVGPGFKVLDVGCGSGTVSFAAAARAPEVKVVALDSHSRAVECTTLGATLNELPQVTAVLNDQGQAPDPGTYDLVLGNPPYYSNYQIAEIFLQAAVRALKPGGKVLIVAKSHAWYDERMPDLFDDVQQHLHKQYTVVEGTQRG